MGLIILLLPHRESYTTGASTYITPGVILFESRKGCRQCRGILITWDTSSTAFSGLKRIPPYKYFFDLLSEFLRIEFQFLYGFHWNLALLSDSNIGCTLYHWWLVYKPYCCRIQERSVASIGQFEPRTVCTWLDHHWRTNNGHRRTVQVCYVIYVTLSRGIKINSDNNLNLVQW